MKQQKKRPQPTGIGLGTTTKPAPIESAGLAKEKKSFLPTNVNTILSAGGQGQPPDPGSPPPAADALPTVPPARPEDPPKLDTDPTRWPRPRPGTKLRAIYDYLVAHRGYEVDAMKLQGVSNSLAVHSAIDELRAEDYRLVIINRTEGYSVDDRYWTTTSYYRLIGRLPPDEPGAAAPPVSGGGGRGGAGASQAPAPEGIV